MSQTVAHVIGVFVCFVWISEQKSLFLYTVLAFWFL